MAQYPKKKRIRSKRRDESSFEPVQPIEASPTNKGKKRRSGKKPSPYSTNPTQSNPTARRTRNRGKKGKGRQFAEAVSIHTNVNARNATNVLENVNDYQNPDLEDRVKMVGLARKLRKVEGVCGSVADLLVDFGITKGLFESDNIELKVLLNDWANRINGFSDVLKLKGVVLPVPGLRQLSRSVFDDYITDGDSIFTSFWERGVKVNPNASESWFLPTIIKTMDSLALEVDTDLSSIGVEQLTLTLPDSVISRVTKPESKADQFLIKSLPKEWLAQIRKGEAIILDPNVTYHLKRNPKDYKPWGESFFIKAFSAVAAKRRLQAVDDATIDGLINRFTIFKLGLEDQVKNPAYHVPSPARVESLVNVLTGAKRTNAAVWPGPDLEVIDIGPDGKVLEFDKKYVQADKDILRALHTSPVLIDGSAAGQSLQNWIAFISTEVGLDAIRSALEQLYTQIARTIAQANNLEYEKLFYKFDTQLLKDENKVRNFAIKVFELGGTSIETFLTDMGKDFDTEKRRKEAEQSDGTSELFINPNVPGFTGVPGPATPINPDGDDGRPPGTQDSEASKNIAQALYSETMYLKRYQTIFDKIASDVEMRLQTLPDDTTFAEMALVSGFKQFSSFVEMQLKSEFLLQTGGNYTQELSSLLSWNSRYIASFYNDLWETFKTDPNAFSTEIKAQSSRVSQYARESFRKAHWIGKFAKARLQGITHGKWVCSTEDSRCADKHGRVFDLQFLVEHFPGHPNCLCNVELES